MSNPMYPLPPNVTFPPRPAAVPCGALSVQPCLAPAPAPAPAGPYSAGPRPEITATPVPSLSSARCSVKGCVFPAGSLSPRLCHYHELLQSDSEAQHFQSHQPTHLLSLQAPFGIADEEPDDSRQQDRRRQTAERESYLLDEAA